ncbi:MAG: hypothetical protein IPG45_37250 [Deltaproteobacteria bacterium]|nr:hypothetical protein [Deltaproteobacteria bacterium]
MAKAPALGCRQLIPWILLLSTIVIPEGVAAAPTEGRRVDDIAAELYDDQACRKMVDHAKRRNPKGAFALLKACIDQDKFYTLSYLLAPEWREFQNAQPRLRQLRLIAHTIASSGHFNELDRAELQAAGFPLLTLAESRAGGTQPGSALVLFRGTIKERSLRPDGRLVWLVAETRQVRDYRGQYWSDTDFEAQVLVNEPPMLVGTGNSYFFLGQVRGATDTRTTMDLVDVFAAGVDLGGLVTH